MNGEITMASTTTTGRSFTSETAVETYATGLRNAHALEQQATQLLQRQLDRYERYPEVSQKLQQHLRETEQQIARLEELMHGMGTDPSKTGRPLSLAIWRPSGIRSCLTRS